MDSDRCCMLFNRTTQNTPSAISRPRTRTICNQGVALYKILYCCTKNIVKIIYKLVL